ncbi:MAG: BREX-3 system P-loop-containing protein BrxF [Clostridia bacterium]|nr:BREX-3 system P-loop-containing protein BrxF [Clostridia bacterium]
MGSIYKISSINPDKMNNLMFPIVFCVGKAKISKYTKGYTILSLNEELSKRLLSYDQDKRYLHVTDEINNIIHSTEGPLLITDFEILFDPEHQIDVLKLFVLLNRKKKITVLWPGKCEEDKLKFAEPGYQDYKVYKIKDYDVNCII